MIVYITTNLINGKRYIGKSIKNESFYLGSGKILKKAIKKYGTDNFIKEVIETCESVDELNEREKYWIDFYDAVNDDNFYNLSVGGEVGFEYINRMYDEGLISRNRPHSEETKKKLSDNEERNKKISDKLKGRDITWSDKISASRIGFEVSDETKRKLSERMTGKLSFGTGVCEYCGCTFDLGNLSQYHNEYCKENPNRIVKEFIKKDKCIYCGIECDIANLGRWHNDNCKYKNNNI